MSDFNQTIVVKSLQANVGSVGTSAAQLVAVKDQIAYKKVIIKNTHATQILYVGKVGVSATQGFSLKVNEEIQLDLRHPNEIYVVASDAATTYTWLAY